MILVAKGVEGIRYSPQRRCACLLSFSDGREYVRCVLARASLDGGHGALTGLSELRASEGDASCLSGCEG